MDETLWLIGRILFGALFVGSGIGHLTGLEGSTQYAAAKGVPSPKNAVIISGVVWLLGGLMVIFGFLGDLGAFALAVCLILATGYMHRFWEVTDPEARQVEMAMFMKNVALIGGALFLAGWFAHKNVPQTLTDGVFDFS